jgi:hypothetical protein
MLLADILNPLTELESAFAQLQHTDAFQTLKMRQKAQYHYALESLRELIRDLEQDNAQEELAS